MMLKKSRGQIPMVRRLPMIGAAVAVFSVIVLAPPAVTAQDLGPVMDRLDRLERDIRTLNIQISRGAGAKGAAAPISAAADSPASNDPGVARLTQRLDALEQDIRNATGSMEQLGHQILQLTERLDKLVGDVDFRLSTLETKLGVGAGGTAAQATPPAGASSAIAPRSIQGVPVDPSVAAADVSASASTSGPQTLGTVSAKAVQNLKTQPPVAVQQVAPQRTAAAAPLPAGTVKEKYTYALNLLRQTNYDQAEIALTEFVAQHGDNPLAGNARYWLGETYYVRADYEQAAQTFFQGYQASPANAKAPDMLLKLGMSLSQLKKKAEACATFDKLAGDFPNASTRINSAVGRERKRAGCR